MTDTPLLNLHWADALIGALAGNGARHAVISPGSRSTPLVLACQRHPNIRTWVQVDERSAAFFALGLARDSHAPTLLIATSGSAPTHWYPAVIEADASNIPLLLLSADRPPELRHCGANQTIDQQRLFGTHVRAFYDAGPAQPGQEGTAYIRALAHKVAQRSLWPQPGPVHFNLALREPLVPASLPPRESFEPLRVDVPLQGNPAATPGLMADLSSAIGRGRGVIVCGPDDYPPLFADAVTRLAATLACPILADPLSGLRFGAHDGSRIMTAYDAFLRSPAFVREHHPEWLLRFGRAPVSTTLNTWLQSYGDHQILVSAQLDWPDPQQIVRHVVRAAPDALCMALNTAPGLASASPSWQEGFTAAEARAHALRLDVASADGRPDRPSEDRVIREIVEEAPAGSLLFVGNSLPVRQLDTWSGSGAKSLRIFANRGVSGIDGNISTLLGLAAADSGPVIGLIGDLACYHDLNGLQLASNGLNAVIIVLNNGGGGIFGYLPQADLNSFDDYWLTPTRVELVHAAKAYHVHFRRVMHAGEFRPALASALRAKGVTLVEVMLDRDYSMALHKAYWDAVATD